MRPSSARVLERLRAWPTADRLLWFDRRLGLYLVSLAALYGLKWRNGYDLNAFVNAAADVAHGLSAYAATLSVGVTEWGIQQVYVSPPFVAHALAPVSGAPRELLFVLWNLAGLAAVAGAVLSLDRDLLARRAPRLVFGLGYVWATVFLGQVNLFVLAGLLLALGSRDDRLAGFGLAVAGLLRFSPLALGIVLVFERRWRALAWTTVFLALGVLASGPAEWLTFARVARDVAAASTLAVPVQTSAQAFGLGLAILAGSAAAAVVLLAGRVPREAALLRGMAIAVAVVVLPSNGWVHWYAWALVPILLRGDRALWSRRALAAFLVVAFLPLGVPSMVVALVTLGAMTWRVIRPPAETRVQARPIAISDPAA